MGRVLTILWPMSPFPLAFLEKSRAGKSSVQSRDFHWRPDGGGLLARGREEGAVPGREPSAVQRVPASCAAYAEDSFGGSGESPGTGLCFGSVSLPGGPEHRGTVLYLLVGHRAHLSSLLLSACAWVYQSTKHSPPK